jgi:hypothetical protein
MLMTKQNSTKNILHQVINNIGNVKEEIANSRRQSTNNNNGNKNLGNLSNR